MANSIVTPIAFQRRNAAIVPRTRPAATADASRPDLFILFVYQAFDSSQLARLRTLPATLAPRAGAVPPCRLASCARAVIFRGQLPSASRAL
jgi:hypothetical protein